ncbi:MAG: murein transglycosylase A [Pseudodesulfovibrio sp.]|nr:MULTISPECIES: murein transglycosylase A [Pseudodesulfovibrio]MBU4192328.1 murein transglycosylase A [Pseudomonadota bacterium]MBU4244488.1 murein transglycosylase A [Pseudomonadota bacterium]MBU4380410.1 murein transglycosylase A [Pseudomonadota bacterium]MBU4475928.1 murein transglycosylase A [Pseudomonadota bacterium]MBU4516766.1 murein transglycosylase A [Pseudomonadota bacterium]
MTLRLFPAFALVLLLAVFASGCAKGVPAPETGAKPAPVKDMTPAYALLGDAEAAGLAASLSVRVQGLGSWTALRPGLEDSLRYILRRPQNAVCVSRPGLTLTWAQLGDGVAELIGLLPGLDADPGLVAERFAWLRVEPGTLLTGYYEPWLEASLTPGGEYKYPLYAQPDDLKTVDLGKFHPRWQGQSLVYRVGQEGIEPYHDRAAIDAKSALAGRGHEIAWVKDPVDIFFLQVQGSGRLVLPDGSVRHILYGGRNGREYVSIGKVLINQGHVPREEMSMQRIREFLSANPDKAGEVMFANPSYVFFRLSDVGPFGAMNTILTPRVSVAVDRAMTPLGSVLALKTSLMDYATGQSEPFMSLVLAQDTGGAIQGTRMDLFCGSGSEAETLAGHLQEQSEVFMLVSRRVLDARTDQTSASVN